jgi:hypothetical protein
VYNLRVLRSDTPDPWPQLDQLRGSTHRAMHTYSFPALC